MRADSFDKHHIPIALHLISHLRDKSNTSVFGYNVGKVDKLQITSITKYIGKKQQLNNRVRLN